MTGLLVVAGVIAGLSLLPSLVAWLGLFPRAQLWVEALSFSLTSTAWIVFILGLIAVLV